MHFPRRAFSLVELLIAVAIFSVVSVAIYATFSSGAAVLRRVKDRARHKFNLAIAEVGDNDVWQRALLGVAVLGSGRRFVESALDEVVRFVRGEAEVTNVEREIQTLNDSLAENDLGFPSR